MWVVLNISLPWFLEESIIYLSKIVVVYVGHVSQLHPFITVKDDNERLVTLSPTYHW